MLWQYIFVQFYKKYRGAKICVKHAAKANAIFFGPFLDFSDAAMYNLYKKHFNGEMRDRRNAK